MRYRRFALAIALAAAVTITWGFQNTADYKVLFEKAKFAMETKGDLQGAIKIFQEIISKFPQEKEYAARAQLYIGLCFEKLGNAEAIKAYEVVLKKYADRPEEVAIARERLATLRQESPSDIAVIRFSPEAEALDYKRMSPDGTKVVGVDYSKGMNIAVFDLATQSQTLLTDYTWAGPSFAVFPVWSRDGGEITYARFGLDGKTWEFIVSTLSGKERVLFRTEVWNGTPLDWLPDGSALVAALATQQYDKTSPLDATIGLIPSSGGSFKPLHRFRVEASRVESTPGGKSGLSLSPDGRFIAFQEVSKEGSWDIFIMSIDGQSLEVLTDHPADDLGPLWSPDGKHIAFQSRRQGDWALWGVAVNDGKPQGQPFMVKEGTGNSSFLDWTPQGLFQETRIQMFDIYTMPVSPDSGEPAGKPRPWPYVPTGLNRWPAWSPDGKSLAFASGSWHGDSNLFFQGRIIIMPREGGKPREFPIPANIYEDMLSPTSNLRIRWLPDSSGLGFYCRDLEGKRFVYRLTIGTGEWKTVRLPGPIKSPSTIEWSKDGQSCYYCKGDLKENNPGIFEYNMETGEDRQVYSPQGGNGWITYGGMTISPDYRWLAFHEEFDFDDYGIVVLDLETGKSRRAVSRLSRAAWSPDQKVIMATMDRLIEFDESAKKEGPFYVLVSLAESSQKKITLADGVPKSRIRSIDWSRDGKEIAFDIAADVRKFYLLRNVIPKGHS